MQYTLDLSQRWNGGRASYRKPGHTIQVAEYDVASIPDDATARASYFSITTLGPIRQRDTGSDSIAEASSSESLCSRTHAKIQF